MTSDVAFLLSKGYVPIVRHDSPSFSFLEQEAARASAGLLGQEIRCHALRTDRSNAYTVRLPTSFFLGVTDTLMQDMSFDTLDLLGHPSVAAFFGKDCGYGYDPRAPAPTRETLDSPTAAEKVRSRVPNPYDNTKVHLFNSIFFNGVIAFVVLHEIGHVKHRHFDGMVPGAAFADLPEDSGSNQESDGKARETRLKREHEADTAAASWRAQQIIRAVRAHPQEAGKYWLEFAAAFLGATVPVRRLSRQTRSDAATHPLPQERIHNIAYWLSLVANSEYPQVSFEQHFDFFGRLTFLIEKAVGDLRWPPLTWEADYRPFSGRPD